MVVTYNFENKILVYGGNVRSDVCGKAFYRYNIYQTGLRRFFGKNGRGADLVISSSVHSLDVVTRINVDANNNVSYVVESFDVIRPDECTSCNKDCVYIVLYNVFGLDCISSNEYIIENGGIEGFAASVYSLMQYVNIRIKCSVTFKDAEHSHAWKTSIGAFRKTYVYFEGKEFEGYIDFSTLSFVDNGASCNFDVVAKIL